MHESYRVEYACRPKEARHVSIRFSATIYQRGATARIDVPEKVTKAFADTGYVPVRGTMKDAGIRGTLMPAGGGRHVLNINLEMRQRAHVEIGDSVIFTLDRGEATRFPPMSRELAVALETDAPAKATWEQALPAKRKDVLARLAKQRTQEAVLREVDRALDRLRRGKI
jgi:uncharacterized protein DUF1905